MRRVEYWACNQYRYTEEKCSSHKSLRAAIRAAKKCEAIGGAKHHFLKVERLTIKVKRKATRDAR